MILSEFSPAGWKKYFVWTAITHITGYEIWVGLFMKWTFILVMISYFHPWLFHELNHLYFKWPTWNKYLLCELSALMSHRTCGYFLRKYCNTTWLLKVATNSQIKINSQLMTTVAQLYRLCRPVSLLPTTQRHSWYELWREQSVNHPVETYWYKKRRFLTSGQRESTCLPNEMFFQALIVFSKVFFYLRLL